LAHRRHAGTSTMTILQDHFAKAHLFVFLGIWLSFTALTYWIAEHGIEQDSHCRLVILTTLAAILGPMTGDRMEINVN
jgi:hypothetical protein